MLLVAPWRAKGGEWWQFPEEYHEPLDAHAKAGMDNSVADAIGQAVPGRDPLTFVGCLQDTEVIQSLPHGLRATPPALRANPDGSETIFWWHPLDKRWAWFDVKESQCCAVPALQSLHTI